MEHDFGINKSRSQKQPLEVRILVDPNHLKGALKWRRCNRILKND